MFKFFLYVILVINLLYGKQFLVKAQNDEVNAIVKQNFEQSFSVFIKNTSEDLQTYFQTEFNKKATELNRQLKSTDLINNTQNTVGRWWENAWKYVQTEFANLVSKL